VCTDSLGNYTLPLAGGTYPVQWYDGAPYEGLATPVVVADGAATTGIDAVLDNAAAISGTVTNAAGDPIPGICVYPYDAATGNRTADPSACTDSTGKYTLSVPAGASYNIVFYDPSGTSPTQWYNGAPYESGATPVTVSGGTVTGIDAVLGSTTSAITGTVVDGAGHGIANICVYPFLAATTGRTADPAACTDASGDYTLAVAPGSYNVVFYDATHTFATQWYSGAAYEGLATPVAVSAGTPTTGIGATLTP
jgi:hypothetical protein